MGPEVIRISWRSLLAAVLIAGPSILVATVDPARATATSCAAAPKGCEYSPALRKSPHGRLAPNRIGRLRLGAGQHRARNLFGRPDRSPRFAGCPLNPADRPVRMFEYRLGGRTLRLYFDLPGGFTSYLTDSPRFLTRRGVRVNSSFRHLRRAYGRKLRPFNLGSMVSTPRRGTYLFRAHGRISHWFNVENRRVTRISGGILEICE